MGIQVALSISSRIYLVCDWVILTIYLFQSYLVVSFIYLYLSGFSLNGRVMLTLEFIRSILVRMFIVKTICCNFYPLIQLVYLSIEILRDVTLFRMAPPTRLNLEHNEGSQENPPPPTPPPKAWQAVIAATNANAQMLFQLLQERN